MAKYTLDGKKIFNKILVDRITDFSEDNFPDFCILWHQNSFLVSTGSSNRTIKIRQIDTEGKILRTAQMTPSSDHFSSIGNSFYFDGSGVHLFSAKMDPQASTLVDLTLDADFMVIKTFYHSVIPQWEQVFPTHSLKHNNLIYVVYDSRQVSEKNAKDPLHSPYSPYVKILNQTGQVLLHSQIGTNGFAHVHPSMALIGDNLFVAWSQAAQNGGNKIPQVQVVEYQILTAPTPNTEHKLVPRLK